MPRFPLRFPISLCFALCMGAAAPVPAADLVGRVVAGDGIETPPALSVAVDDWVCGEGGTIEDPRLVLSSERGIADVVVHVAGVPNAPAYRSPGSPEIDQRGCVFVPHVVLVGVDEEVTVRNSDPALHTFRTQSAKNRGVNRAQPKGKVDVLRFSEPETIRVACDVHYWMSAVVVVAADAFTALTAADGTFSVPGLPPGSYRAQLWHETLGTRDVSIVVGQEGGRLDFTWDREAAVPATD